MCACVLQLYNETRSRDCSGTQVDSNSDPFVHSEPVVEDSDSCSQSVNTLGDSKTGYARQFGDPGQFAQCRPDDDSNPDPRHFM